MTLFASGQDEPRPTRRRRPKRSSLRVKTGHAKRLSTPAPPTTTAAGIAGPLRLSPEAQELYDQIDSQWTLTPPVRALLRIACEAITKAGDAESITAREGMTIGDAKGAAKPHPAALLSRDYRSLAAATLQRILSNLGSV